MSVDAIQNDFGGFDSKFVGITLRLWPRSWDIYNNICMSDRDPEEVLHIGNAALMGPPGEAFEVFSTGTVMLHELRHFHDFLLSPFGSLIFRRRLVAAINGMTVLGALKRSGSFIPVPFPRWRKSTPLDQEELLEMWRAMSMPTLSMPKFAMTDDVSVALDQVEKSYAAIANLIAAPPNKTSVSYFPSHIFEGSAIALQANNVFNVFGAEHSLFFVNYLLNEPTAQPYTLALRALNLAAEEQGRQMDMVLLSAALTWSILGDYSVEGWEACPTIRFARLINLFRTEGMPDTDLPMQELLDAWSTRLECLPVNAAIDHAIHENITLLKRIEATLGQDEQMVQLATVFRNVVRAQQRMAALFKIQADNYIRPYLYAEKAKHWVAAPIRLEFPYLPLVGMRGELERNLHVRVAQQMKDGRLAVRAALQHGKTEGVDLFLPNDVADLTDLLNLMDFFFAEFKRDEPDFQVARQVTANEGMVTFEIL